MGRTAGVAAAAVLGVAAIATPAAAGAASPATYHMPSGKAFGLGVLRSASHPGHAFLAGNYKCYGGQGVLWASVKQGGPDPTAEGSSATVKSWYDGHFALNCNGRTHNLIVEVTKEAPNPGHPAAYRNLRRGPAWIQWCVTDSKQGLSSFSRWLPVFIATQGMTR